MQSMFLCAARWLAVALLAAWPVRGVAEAGQQIIVLKLDDVTASGAKPGQPVSPRWLRVTEYLQRSGLKACFGIIGFSLEEDNPQYFEWVKALARRGDVEFWNHGYADRKASDKTGEFERPYEEQKSALLKTQRLAREKLGLELRVFGPHWSGITSDTGKALDEIPEIAIWFYGNPKWADKFVLERVLTLENPTFVPDFEKFREHYERSAKDRKCLALQGHPNAWDDQRWEGFVRIVEYLKGRGCAFMTASECLAAMAEGQGGPHPPVSP